MNVKNIIDTIGDIADMNLLVLEAVRSGNVERINAAEALLRREGILLEELYSQLREHEGEQQQEPAPQEPVNTRLPSPMSADCFILDPEFDGSLYPALLYEMQKESEAIME